MIKLVVTDLDDTLYSWIGFFIPAFYEMVQKLSELISIPQEELLREYKEIHQQVGNVEYPFATLNLPSVKRAYCGCTEEQIKKELDPAFHKFNSKRNELLKLYPGVEDTLKFLEDSGIPVIAYTESAEENGFYRLKKLGIDHFFKKVYVSDSLYKRSQAFPASPKTFAVHGKKPNIEVLKKICEDEKTNPGETLYVGDSLSKDMLMAKNAGAVSVWCDYLGDKTCDLYSRLVAISHWNREDFQREEQYKKEWKSRGYAPDFTIHSFDECKKIILNLNRG